MPKKNKPYLEEVLNHKKVLANTPDPDKLSVTLKEKNPYGTGLFATKLIQAGQTIAWYRMCLVDINKPFTEYTFHHYTKSGNLSHNLVGDLFEGSVPPPKRGIPYWAHFVNEPGPQEQPNATIDTNTNGNYKNRKILRKGHIIEYKLVAVKDIRPGAQVFWCYGEDYHARDYSTSCST
jgi:hypothetical protein